MTFVGQLVKSLASGMHLNNTRYYFITMILQGIARTPSRP